MYLQLSFLFDLSYFLHLLMYRLPLSVSFTPSVEGPVSFRLKLKVKKKSEPLTLTVKADCFAMNALLQLGKADEPFREIAPNLQESLDFGTVSSTRTNAASP